MGSWDSTDGLSDGGPPPAGARPSSMETDPAEHLLKAIESAAIRSDHPYGGLEFQRRGVAVCYARLSRLGPRAVEVSGMYAPVRGGGCHAMGLIALLADLHGVTLRLVAASAVPSRMDTERVVEWYRAYGFVGSARSQPYGGVPMARLPGRLFRPPVAGERQG